MTPSIEIPGLRQAASPQGKVLGLPKEQNGPDDTNERPEFSGLMAALRNGNRAAPAAEEGEKKSNDGVDMATELDMGFTGSFNLLALQAERSSKAPTNNVPDPETELVMIDGQAPLADGKTFTADREAPLTVSAPFIAEADTSLTGGEPLLTDGDTPSDEGGETDLVLAQTPRSDVAAAQNPGPAKTAEATVTMLPSDLAGQASEVSVTTAQVAQAAVAIPVAPQQLAAKTAQTNSLARQTASAEPAAIAAAIAPAGQPAAGPAKAKAQREPTTAVKTGTEAAKDQVTTQANPPAFSRAATPENRAAPRDSQAITIQIHNKDAGADPAAQPKTMPDAGQPSTAQPQAFGGMMISAAANDLPPPIDAPQQISDPIVISTTDPNWEVEFVDSIVAQVSGENAVIDLALTPENLGKVEVRIELRDGRADVTFVTETREAARLFAQAEGRLSDLMQRHGLDLGGQDTSHREAPARPSANARPLQSVEGETAAPTRLAPEGRVNLVA